LSSENDSLDRLALGKIVGVPIVAAERCAWGFENRTDIVTLEAGRRLVVQRITNRSLARQKVRLARMLPDRLAAVGVRAPRVIMADAEADPPYIVREYLAGAPGSTLMDSDGDAIRLAVEMGAILRRLASVPTAGAALHTGWSDPARIARQASRQLERCSALFDAATSRALTTTITAVAAHFAGQPGQFAHGDFCPINTLVEGGRVVALLDLEFARIADPLFDAAWWGWVVRFHHPERWVAAWPQFLDAAGIAADAATLARIGILQRLRCLEVLDYTRTFDPERTALWLRHLSATLGWEEG
jgi:aminoglycoside phosphotransferase (APT) family kinase protein